MTTETTIELNVAAMTADVKKLARIESAAELKPGLLLGVFLESLQDHKIAAEFIADRFDIDPAVVQDKIAPVFA